MKKLLALVLVFMLCLPAFAFAASAPDRKLAEKAIVHINEILVDIKEEDNLPGLESITKLMQFTTVSKEEDNIIIYESKDPRAMCQLVFTDDGSKIKGIYLIASDVEPSMMNSEVIIRLAEEYFGADSGLSSWMLGTLVDVLDKLLDLGDGKYLETYDLDGAKVDLYGNREGNNIAFIYDLIADESIPVA